MGTIFSAEQVMALCGGELPQGYGFNWKEVTHFELEDDMLQPYAENQIMPGPGIAVRVDSPKVHDHSRVIHGRSPQTDRYPDGCLVQGD